MSVGHEQAAELLGSLSSLIRATRAIARTHEMGASGTPLGVLKTLRSGDARPGDLAVALHVAPSVISRAIGPLETAGLVERTTDPADGRASLLTLTPAGAGRLEALQRAYVDQVTQVLGDWTDDEAREAAGLIRRLERALSESAAVEAHERLISGALAPTGTSQPLSDSPPDPSLRQDTDTDVDAHQPEPRPTSTRPESTRKPVHV